MATLTSLVTKLEARVQDDVFPITTAEYEDEIQANILHLGYDLSTLPQDFELLVLLMCQVNLFYNLSGKHARNFRTRVEGDMDIHAQQVAENYLKLAMRLEDRLDKYNAGKIDTIEMIEATRWRVSTNSHVPRADGSGL